MSLSRVLLLRLLGLVVVAAVLAGGWYAVATVRRSFPQTGGRLVFLELDGPVDIYRDSLGVPNIYASSVHDLFFAQGFVHAQDRFWQMDTWRHIGAGATAELFGADQVEADLFLRNLGWERIARQEWDILDDHGREVLQAYADGVNAYLRDREPGEISLEYALLGLQNPDYRPAPWEPVHSLTWLKVMAWDLRGNMDAELERSMLSRVLTTQQIDELYPPYPADHPVIAGGFGPPSAQPIAPPPTALPDLDVVAAKYAALDELTGGGGDAVGSNSWVIGGSRTVAGKPILANDPHLSIQMPSIWYTAGLHCAPVSSQCPYDVSGVSFPGLPAVAIGHNQRIAWGLTNLGPDVMDLYIERVNPVNRDQYEVNGEWVDMEVRVESISVAGEDAPRVVALRDTRHGPVISDTHGAFEAFAVDTGLELPDSYAVALRWTALDPGRTFQALLGVNTASNWEEFRQALRDFDAPSQNVVYADVDGNIGYQAPGNIPIRAAGDGRWPVPGWTDENEWIGFIPFDDLPSVLNPPQDYIVTANNQVAGGEYPYFITSEWNHGFRAERIVEMIEQQDHPFIASLVSIMQGDNANLNARRLAPAILSLDASIEEVATAQTVLEGWEFQQHADLAAPAFFEVFWGHLLARTFHDDLPEDQWPEGGSRWFAVADLLLDQPDAAWWDDRDTPTREARDAVLTAAVVDAVRELTERLGNDPDAWRWGDLHRATFRNQTLGVAGPGPVQMLFNRGGFRVSGGTDVVNATAWDAAAGDYEVTWLPSMRMVVDLADFEKTTLVHTTGQSGHAYHANYADQIELWRLNDPPALPWDRASIERQAVSRLELLP